MSRSLLNEFDAAPWLPKSLPLCCTWPPKPVVTHRERLREITWPPTPAHGFRYVEITKQGDFWVAEEVDIHRRHIRAVGATSEKEVRAAVGKNKWVWT